MPAFADLPVLFCGTPAEWQRWLAENHATTPGVWLQIAKKAASVASVSYDAALELALCYGWIDGQKQAQDVEFWRQKFSPRGPRSLWSAINREKATRLIAAGQMQPAGLRAVEQAQANGRWDAAYTPQRTAEAPADLLQALAANAEAQAFFATLSGVNRYAVLFRIQTAKRPETRAARIAQFVSMLARHETVYPARGKA
ncbi:MAG: YdeI/OmpD-associated family protein [Dehalococcoidia bacterium]